MSITFFSLLIFVLTSSQEPMSIKLADFQLLAISLFRHLAISLFRHLAISPSRHLAISPSRHLTILCLQIQEFLSPEVYKLPQDPIPATGMFHKKLYTEKERQKCLPA